MIWIFNIAVVIAFAVVVAKFLKIRDTHFELIDKYSEQVTRADRAVIDRDVYENRWKEEREKRTELEKTVDNSSKKIKTLTAENNNLKTKLKQAEETKEIAPVEADKPAKKTTTRKPRAKKAE